MELFRGIKERLEKRRAQKTDNLINKIDQDIRSFSDKNSSIYFSEKNLDHINVILFEDEIWKIRQVFDKYKYEIKKLCKNDSEARKKFQEAERKFIRRARLWHEFRKRGVRFSEKQMKELMALEANPHGQDRISELKVMGNNFRVIAQAEGGIEQDIEKNKQVIKKNKAKEKRARYIKELLPAMQADKIWMDGILKEKETMETINKQREALRKHVLKNKAEETTKSAEQNKGSEDEPSKQLSKKAEKVR